MPAGALLAVGSVGASIFGASKNSKAINKAADAQAAATREATALQRDIYNKNVGFQTPFLNTGNAAMGQINALLGLNVPGGGASGGAGGAGGPTSWDQVMSLRHNGIDGDFRTAATQFAAANPLTGYNGPQMSEILGMAHDGVNGNFESALSAYDAAVRAQPPASAGGSQTSGDAALNANQAYDRFKNYTGYTTRLNEGLNAINSGYAANGTLQSGAAMQALNKYGQDYASNEFTNYMGYLGGQQQLGPGAANALAGVGTNYANAAGNLAIQNGNNIANAAVAKANNTNAMLSGIGSALGSAFGGIKF